MMELGQRGTESATTTTKEKSAYSTHAPSDTYAIGHYVREPTLDTNAPSIPDLPLNECFNSNADTSSVGNISDFGSQVTPINVDLLEASLANNPDKQFVNKLCNDLRNGARVGFNGLRAPRFSRNLPTASTLPGKVQENLDKEVNLGRTAGPFLEPPFPNFQVSPIGLVPKKHSGKYRTIFHLSYPKSGSFINSAIDKEEFSLSYVPVDDAIKAIQKLGKGAYMAKTDIESAFRLIPVHPDDWELLGMYWGGYYYFDKVLPIFIIHNHRASA